MKRKEQVRMFKKATALLLLVTIYTTGCTVNDPVAQPEYEQTKKMVVDILKTDDGKKAIRDIMSDDELKHELVLEQPVVAETIENTLVSERGSKFWKEQFKDPKFAESFAKSMEKENEKLLKSLMDDPDYRGKMIEVLKDPEIEKDLSDLLKSNEYRQHLQKVITETLESPLYQVKIQEILIKAAEDMKKKPEEKENNKENDGGGDGDGGGGGGEQG